jgi:hypothetical protein
VYDRVYYLLGRYKDPHYRCRGLGIAAFGANQYTIQQMLGQEIGTRITVIRRPQGGTAITILYRIEGIEQRFERGQLVHTRFALSTAPAMDYWMVAGAIGDEWAANAVLGTTTILAF